MSEHSELIDKLRAQSSRAFSPWELALLAAACIESLESSLAQSQAEVERLKGELAEGLTREVEKDRHGINALHAQHDLIKDAARLLERAESAEAALLDERTDAERWRWLRKASSEGKQTRAHEIMFARYYPEADVDAAIDAALRALPSPKPSLPCEKCGADRYKEPCRGAAMGCPLHGVAAKPSDKE